MAGSDPRFFSEPAEFRAWLETHHAEARELLVGFHKKATGRGGLTWEEAVDEALCFGWIDGRRTRIDDLSHAIRFTPRRPGSVWSNRNVERVKVLKERGRMRPAGLAAFEKRRESRSGVYSFEQEEAPELAPGQVAAFQANPSAWSFFSAQAPWYRRAATWWVISAKREETRARRLATLIEDSAHGRTLAHLTRRPK